MRPRICVLALVGLFACGLPAADSSSSKEVVPSADAQLTLGDQLRGKWVLYQETKEGRFMTIKEHTGDHTIVTTYGPTRETISSHRSEYRIDTSGNVPVFRYRNREVVKGPKAGEKDATEHSYLFRLEGDRFYEVHGMLPGDAGKPSLIVWERYRNPEAKL